MGGMSDYMENLAIDHVYRTATWAKPSALWVALFTATPSDSGGGTEVTGGSYARVNLAPSDTNWLATQGGTSGASSGTSGQTSNAVAIVFPAPTANWGTVTSFAIMTASTAGNFFVWGDFTVAKAVLNGDQAPVIAIAGMTATFT